MCPPGSTWRRVLGSWFHQRGNIKNISATSRSKFKAYFDIYLISYLQIYGIDFPKISLFIWKFSHIFVSLHLFVLLFITSSLQLLNSPTNTKLT